MVDDFPQIDVLADMAVSGSIDTGPRGLVHFIPLTRRQRLVRILLSVRCFDHLVNQPRAVIGGDSRHGDFVGLGTGFDDIRQKLLVSPANRGTRRNDRWRGCRCRCHRCSEGPAR